MADFAENPNTEILSMAFDDFKSDLLTLLPSLSKASIALQESVKDVMQILNQAESVESSTTQKTEQLLSDMV